MRQFVRLSRRCCRRRRCRRRRRRPKTTKIQTIIIIVNKMYGYDLVQVMNSHSSLLVLAASWPLLTSNGSTTGQFWRLSRRFASVSGRSEHPKLRGAAVGISTTLCKCRMCGQSMLAIACDRIVVGLGDH